MQNKYKSLIVYTLLAGIVVAGFFFRLQGILDNHSFWSDEAFVAGLGRNILLGKMTFFQATKILNYQPLNILLTVASLKLFGFTEFATRFPIVLFGTLGIIASFLLARKLSDSYGGLLAAFLYAFSQLNLANHTQAKPHSILQTLLIFDLYLITILDASKKKSYIHCGIIVLSLLSTLFHILGFIIWLPYITYLVTTQRKNLLQFNYQKAGVSLVVLLLFLLTFYFTSGLDRLKQLIGPGGIHIIVAKNNITYLREILWKNYSFITLPSIFGLMISFKKNKAVAISIMSWVLVLLYLWTFRAFHNLRYLLPFFGLLFVFFGVFWSEIAKRVFNKSTLSVCFFVAVIIFAGGYKITRFPQKFYNPNQDFYGDVQIANYKLMYGFIKNKYPDISRIGVFNDAWDAQYWYLSEKASDVYFLNPLSKPYSNNVDGHMVYGTLKDFLHEKEKFKKGILIVEDWDSLLPDDIKSYAKSNLTREFRTDSIPQAKNDPWPLEVYSWETK